MMDFSKYIISLRVNLKPDKYEKINTERLLSSCKKFGFNDVMFFINNAENAISHPTKEEMAPYVEAIKRAKVLLNENGITVSLNPGTTLGQGPYHNGLRGKHAFQTMMGPAGKQSNAEICPLDEDFIKYISDLYFYYAKEIKPEIIWLEDDFRMNNRPLLDWGGCFCPLHMKEYSRELGFDTTREDFVEKLLEKGTCNTNYRLAYAKVTRRAMERLAQEIGDATRRANSETRLGLMTSVPEEHAIEYRDWESLFACLDEREGIDRVHLPTYAQCTPQEYSWLFNRVAIQTRARIPNDTIVLPELENGPHSPYAKSLRFTRMQIETASVLATKGITINIDGQDHNGVIEQWGYGDLFVKERPYLQAIQDLNLDFSSLEGIIVPFSDESVLHMKPTDYYVYLDHIKPDDSFFSGLFSGLGIAYKLVKDPIDVKDQIVAVSGQWFRNFSPTQVENFFRNNYVILNADAVETLYDLGLGNLVNVKSVEWTNKDWYDPLWGVCDRAEEDLDIYGIKQLICSRRGMKYLAISYMEESKIEKIYSRIFDEFDNEVALGMAKVKGCFIFPYPGESRRTQLMHPLYETVLKDVLENNPLGNRTFITSGRCFSPYYFSKNKVLALLNIYDDDAKIEFIVPDGFFFRKLLMVCRDGMKREVKFQRKDNFVTTEYFAEGLSAVYLQFVD
ncbi:MAG: hypothetical protein ACOX43_05895 [Bacilli bacterium]